MAQAEPNWFQKPIKAWLAWLNHFDSGLETPKPVWFDLDKAKPVKPKTVVDPYRFLIFVHNETAHSFATFMSGSIINKFHLDKKKTIYI